MKEKSHTLESAGEAPKENSSSKIVEREPIEKTPFWTVKHEDGWTIVMDKYLICPIKFAEAKEAKEWIDENIYNVITTMIVIIGMITEDMHKINKDYINEIKQ